MPKPVIITADSTVDLSPELKERFQIKIIPLMITLGEDHFMDDGVSFTPLDMYKRYHENGLLPANRSHRFLHSQKNYFLPFRS